MTAAGSPSGGAPVSPMPAGVRVRAVAVADGVDLRVYEAGTDGPLVVLVHGFPELAYSWRHQIAALAAAGYRVIAPDMRGYGGSSAPDEVTDYDIEHLTGDLVALLDDVGAARAVFVGHDWGSMVAWQMALLHPDRVAAVAGLSVPFVRRARRAPIERLREIMGDAFFYILYFQAPGVADAELGADPRRTMRRMLAGLSAGDELRGGSAAMFADDGRGFIERMREPDVLPPWLGESELDHYVDAFTHTGFTGPINWYRNFDRNWERTAHLAEATVTMPSLFIGGSADPVLAMSPPAAGHPYLADHRGDVLVDGVGHWVQQEAPAEVLAALLDFLGAVTER